MSGLQEENTAMHLAAKCGHTAVLQGIMETGVDIDERNIVSGLDWPANFLFIGTSILCLSAFSPHYFFIFSVVLVAVVPCKLQSEPKM